MLHSQIYYFPCFRQNFFPVIIQIHINRRWIIYNITTYSPLQGIVCSYILKTFHIGCIPNIFPIAHLFSKVFYSVGIAAFLETTESNFAKQLDAVISHGADGVSIFALASISNCSYYKPIVEGAFRVPSVQINKLSETTIAQMTYVKSKLDNLSSLFKTLDSDDVAFIVSQCDDLIEFSRKLDVDNSTVTEKISWCNNALIEIAKVKNDIIGRCGNNNDSRSIISEFEDLEYWLELSVIRLNARK